MSGNLSAQRQLIGANGQMVDRANPLPIGLGADAAQGKLKSVTATLNATPGTLTTVTLPDTAQGFRLYPVGSDVRFAIGEDPAAEAAPAASAAGVAQAIAASQFAAGALAKADQWETRLLDAGAGRSLRLRSAAASVVVAIGVW